MLDRTSGIAREIEHIADLLVRPGESQADFLVLRLCSRQRFQNRQTLIAERLLATKNALEANMNSAAA